MLKFKFKVKTKEIPDIPDICLGFTFSYRNNSSDINSRTYVVITNIDTITSKGTNIHFRGINESGYKSSWTSDYVLREIKSNRYKYEGIRVLN